MNDIIVLPSGNVVPSLAEQEAYRERWLERSRARGKRRTWRSLYPNKRFQRKWDISTSGESRFIQTGHEPKTPDQARLDWREKKQFKRDKARHGSHQDGCPPFIKRMCNKSCRQWVRQCIAKERYDLIGSKTRKDFFDPWLWD